MKKTALRFNQGKPELSYILTFPNALRGFAGVCTYGGKKYDRGNYLKGAPLSQYMDCGLRHLVAWNDGEDKDTESEQDHLAHYLWNAFCLYEIWLTQPERDDRINQRMFK